MGSFEYLALSITKMYMHAKITLCVCVCGVCRSKCPPISKYKLAICVCVCVYLLI